MSNKKVTNLTEHRQKKEQKDEAHKFSHNLLDKVFENNGEDDVTPFFTDSLKAVLEISDKKVYFSGDVDEGESRNVHLFEDDSLLYAASTQCYEIECDSPNNRVRLVFDGDYFYDLYFPKNINDSILTMVTTMLEVEQENNFKIKQEAQNKFNKMMQEFSNRTPLRLDALTIALEHSENISTLKSERKSFESFTHEISTKSQHELYVPQRTDDHTILLNFRDGEAYKLNITPYINDELVTKIVNALENESNFNEKSLKKNNEYITKNKEPESIDNINYSQPLPFTPDEVTFKPKR